MTRSFFTLCLLALVGCGAAPTSDVDSLESEATTPIVEVRGFGTNPGQLKMFEHAPKNLPESPGLLVVLHGCTQKASDIATVGWNELADANGFVVVYPEQLTSNNFARCFSWAAAMGSQDDVTRGKGENESIHQMTKHAIGEHHIDPSRVYVAGFSAGAAMSIVLASTWPDVYAGAASLAGMPFDCASSFPEVSSCMSPGKDLTAKEWGRRVRAAFPAHEGPWPKISIWTGTSDTTVSPKNRIQLARQWTNIHGIGERDTEVTTEGNAKHTTWGDKVESYEITGMGHGVPVAPAAGCGKTGQYAVDKGVCAARLITRYFGLTN